MNKNDLKYAAMAKIRAEDTLIEIGEGVGGLGRKYPEMFADWGKWQDISEYDHADTVLILIDEIDRLYGIVKRHGLEGN